MFLYFGVAFLGSLAFGYPEYWFMAMLCAIVVELAVGTVQFKYRDFKQEQENNRLNNG
jgi:ABC-type polysaccharide/polyol phosphate export permease